jgi:predicted metal-binding protein
MIGDFVRRSTKSNSTNHIHNFTDGQKLFRKIRSHILDELKSHKKKIQCVSQLRACNTVK